MKVQINRVNGHQTSKVFAIVFALLTSPFAFMAVFGFMFSTPPETPSGEPLSKFPFLFFALAPIFYGIMGYFMTRFGCFCYNVVSKKFGGIEFETSENNDI